MNAEEILENETAEDKWIAKYRSALDAIPVQQVTRNDLRTTVGQLFRSIASRVGRLRTFLAQRAIAARSQRKQSARHSELDEEKSLSRKAAS